MQKRTTFTCAAALRLTLLLLLPMKAHAADLLSYTVRVAPDLAWLDVSACFAGSVPRALTGYHRRAGEFLREVQLHKDGRTQSLRPAGRQIPLIGVSPGDCISYRVSTMDTRSRWRGSLTQGADRLTDPALWLWLPAPRGERTIEVGFELPDGIAVSAPWTLVDGLAQRPLYRLPDRPADWDARVAFGPMDTFAIEVSGATLRVALLRGRPAAEHEKVERWLSAGAQALTTLYGRFPVPAAQILVVPVGPSREPVPWGQVMRGGGDAVHLYIDQTRPLQEFLDDWTLVHELSHLLHPRIAQDDAWLYEGLASYYQNVLRARAGLLQADTAWNKLHAGFQRGIHGTPDDQSLADVSSNMHRNHRYMRVYWSGAAIALMADRELRQLSNARESLDSALDKFQSCCLPARQKWDGLRFLRKLDELTGSTVFSNLYRQYAHSTAFPDLHTTYRLLGLEPRSTTRVLLREDAPLSALRRAIMSGDEPA